MDGGETMLNDILTKANLTHDQLDELKEGKLVNGCLILRKTSYYAEIFKGRKEITFVIALKLHKCAQQMFQSCCALKLVYAPACEEIGQLAFENCTSLANVHAPKCSRICDSAFFCCTSLAALAIPATKIGASAFAHCTSLARLHIPQATLVGTSCFSRCAKLRVIESKLKAQDLAKWCKQDYCRQKKLCPSCSGCMEACLERGKYWKFLDKL